MTPLLFSSLEAIPIEIGTHYRSRSARSGSPPARRGVCNPPGCGAVASATTHGDASASPLASGERNRDTRFLPFGKRSRP